MPKKTETLKDENPKSKLGRESKISISTYQEGRSVIEIGGEINPMKNKGICEELIGAIDEVLNKHNL